MKIEMYIEVNHSRVTVTQCSTRVVIFSLNNTQNIRNTRSSKNHPLCLCFLDIHLLRQDKR